MDEYQVEKIISEMLNSLVHSRDPKPIIFMVSFFTLKITLIPTDKISFKSCDWTRSWWAWNTSIWGSSSANSDNNVSQIRSGVHIAVEEASDARCVDKHEEEEHITRWQHTNMCQEWSWTTIMPNWCSCFRWWSIQNLWWSLYANYQGPPSRFRFQVLVQIWRAQIRNHRPTNQRDESKYIEDSWVQNRCESKLC